MSFIDSITDAASTGWDWITGSSNSAALAKTALLGFAANQVFSAMNSDAPASAGNRILANPDPNNSIPVIYGTAYTKGIVTDAVLVNNNMTMWYCLTLCEQTGSLLSTGSPSEITMKNIYINQLEVILQGDGVTIDHLVDVEGHTNDDYKDLIKFYIYSGNSTKPIPLAGHTGGNTSPAYSLFPNWSSNNMMSDLVFVLVKIEYNSEKGITALPDIEFKLNNTITQPGDVLNDYLLNTRYGAGIPPGDVSI